MAKKFKLIRQYPSQQSQVKVQYFLAISQISDYRNILVIKFRGLYPIGSEGKSEADFMIASTEFASTFFDPITIIFDFSELDYQWGDEMDWFIAMLKEDNVIILGKKSKKGIKSLIEMDWREDATHLRKRLFKDYETALQFVEKNIEKLDK